MVARKCVSQCIHGSNHKHGDTGMYRILWQLDDDCPWMGYGTAEDVDGAGYKLRIARQAFPERIFCRIRIMEKTDGMCTGQEYLEATAIEAEYTEIVSD